MVSPSHPIDGLCDLPVSLLPGDGDGAGAASALAAADLGAGQAQTVTKEAGKGEIARDVGGGNLERSKLIILFYIQMQLNFVLSFSLWT